MNIYYLSKLHDNQIQTYVSVLCYHFHHSHPFEHYLERIKHGALHESQKEKLFSGHNKWTRIMIQFILICSKRTIAKSDKYTKETDQIFLRTHQISKSNQNSKQHI